MTSERPRALDGRVALVTGAGRKIGRGIAMGLAGEGAAVVVNDLDADAAHRTTEEVRALGGRAVAAVGDMSAEHDVDRVFAVGEETFGTIQVLVNNAYWSGPPAIKDPLVMMDAADWRAFVDRNMALLFLGTRRAARAMVLAECAGSIVNIGSHGALRAHRRMVAYDSVKGAMESFTRATAIELAPWRIRVNVVRPGAIAEEGMASTDRRARGADQIPLGRLGAPMDIAGAVVFLASDVSSYISGQGITVDGGLGAQARPPILEPDALLDPDAVRRALSTDA